MQNKIMFICPFWKQKDHVGTIRAERLVRWMNKIDLDVIVVAAGHHNSIQKTEFGKLVVVKDPLKIYPDVFNKKITHQTLDSQRNPNKFRRWMAYFLLLPDLHIRWTKAVLKSDPVIKMAKNCDYFIASSPPESPFIAAATLSSRFNKMFIMDMRDGWLDEPMKPLLKSMWIQRFREKRIEKSILNKATYIFVTSKNWKELLLNRYPVLSTKTHIIPNCYPEYSESEQKTSLWVDSTKPIDTIQLLHVGRISSSRPERNIELLLDLLLQYIGNKRIKISIKFIGTLDNSEIILIKKWHKLFSELNCRLEHFESVNRLTALDMMTSADGLIMVSNSYASIPAKYYDYSVAGRPVLNFTIKDSASVKVSSLQPQFYHLIESSNSEIPKNDSQLVVIDSFIKHCTGFSDRESKLNPDFTENEVYNRFKTILNNLNYDG